jgi:hypothetical protein
MSERALDELRSCLTDLAALKPWANAANPAHQPFVDAFAAVLARALVAAPAYAEAAAASDDTGLHVWLADTAALLPWASTANPEHQPLVAAFTAARANALAAASRVANGA